MTTKTLALNVWAMSWDHESADYYSRKKPRFICLGCFLRGTIRWTRSPRMLCVKCGSQYREWRRRRGLPPVTGQQPTRPRGWVADMRKRQIIAVLEKRPATVDEIAGKVGTSRDLVNFYLCRLRDEGQTVNLGAVARQKSGTGRRVCLWQLSGKEFS